jgi:membrane protein involved in D-alanine export
MIPYADFAYWGLLLYPALPTFVLAWGRRLRQIWILLATLGMLAVQYAAEERFGSSAAVREIWLLFAVGVFQYVVAAIFLVLRQQRRTRPLFWCAIGLALAPLVGSRILPVVAPTYSLGFLGISYLTFRCPDVAIGIQDGLIRALPLHTYFAYIFFFPTISAGPIDRYRRFLTDWTHSRTWREFIQDLDGAVHRIFTGFLYKFILAELIRRYWLDPAAGMPGPGVIAYMYAYSLYLFFDFAGYTAFAVGVGYLFGIHTLENFHQPFLARDIRDFWNRWHISLSWWLRDHVYMRFVMAATRHHWFGNRYFASYLGFCLSMGLMGLWHGFAGQYLAYGLYHALLLIGHDLFTRWNRVHALWRDTLVWRMAGVVLTSQFVCFGFLIFSGHLSPRWFQ